MRITINGMNFDFKQIRQCKIGYALDANDVDPKASNPNASFIKIICEGVHLTGLIDPIADISLVTSQGAKQLKLNSVSRHTLELHTPSKNYRFDTNSYRVKLSDTVISLFEVPSLSMNGDILFGGNDRKVVTECIQKKKASEISLYWI